MDIGALFSDSFTYAQEALVGKYPRWAIFVLFALPFSLIQFTFDPRTIITGTGINWDAIPWAQIAILAGLGFILSFFISGYIVRIYRGITPAPDFTGWKDLFVDGVKLAVLWFIWFLPILILLGAICAIAFAAFLSAQATAAPDWLLIVGVLLLLLLVEFVLFMIVMLLGIIGAVRFARTGSIREGIRISAILTTIRTIGWLPYIILLIGFAIVSVIYAAITGILSAIPFIGWVFVIIVNPFFMIFTARYFALVYDLGEPKPVAPAPVG